VRLAGRRARTDARGRVTLLLPEKHGRYRLAITAGDTFQPAVQEVGG
jgi:hypothetical protein